MTTHAITLPPLTPPLWTQDQALAYEAACECIGEVMAICSADLHRENRLLAPNAQRVAALQIELVKLGDERAALRVGDAQAVAAARATYGARVRAYRAQRQQQAA